MALDQSTVKVSNELQGIFSGWPDQQVPVAVHHVVCPRFQAIRTNIVEKAYQAVDLSRRTRSTRARGVYIMKSRQDSAILRAEYKRSRVLAKQAQIEDLDDWVLITTVAELDDHFTRNDDSTIVNILITGPLLLVLEVDSIHMEESLLFIAELMGVLRTWSDTRRPVCVITLGAHFYSGLKRVLPGILYGKEYPALTGYDTTKRSVVASEASKVSKAGKSIVMFDRTSASGLAQKLGVPLVEITALSTEEETRDVVVGTPWRSEKIPSAVIYVDVDAISGPIIPYKLGLVVSSTYTTVAFDRAHTAYIKTLRYIDAATAFIQAEYAAKAGCALLVTFREEDVFESIPYATFKGDMYLVAYQVAWTWPGTSVLDTPLPLNLEGISIIESHLRRLELLKAVTSDDGFAFRPSITGQLALEIANACKSYKDIFATACRVAMLKHSGLSVRLQRVAIRLLLLGCLGTWCQLPTNGIDLGDVELVCSGPGKALVRRGNCWALWGLWETAIQCCHRFTDTGDKYTIGVGCHILIQGYRDVLNDIQETEKMLSIDPSASLDGTLEPSDILALDEFLVEAFLRDLIIVPKVRTESPRHISSGQPIALGSRLVRSSHLDDEHDSDLSPEPFPGWLAIATGYLKRKGGAMEASNPLLVPAHFLAKTVGKAGDYVEVFRG